MTPEMQQKIAIWRSKSAAGELSLDDYREAIRALRGDRKNAQATSDASRRKAVKAEIPAADDLLDELEGI